MISAVIHMTVRLALAFALLLCAGALGILAAINHSAIIDAVNAKLPTNNQFESIGWYPTKTLRLHREYRRLYPDGNLISRQGILAAIMLFCIVVVAALLGFGFLAIGWVGGGGALSLWLMYFRKL